MILKDPAFTVELPYPPSVNHLWRYVGQRPMISRRGRVYRDEVFAAVTPVRPKLMTGPLDLEIEMYPPDNKRRDVDNILKATLDSLKYARVYKDDSQVKRLTVE